MRCISWDDFRSSNVRFLEKALTGKDPVYVRRTDDILLQIVPVEVAIETDEQLDEITNEWCAAQRHAELERCDHE
jgi:hypothetical protein